jgi:hypothetical protein
VREFVTLCTGGSCFGWHRVCSQSQLSNLPAQAARMLPFRERPLVSRRCAGRLRRLGQRNHEETGEMTTNPQKSLRVLAAAGCVLLAATVAAAQNQQQPSDDSERSQQEANEQDRNRDPGQAGNQNRDDQNRDEQARDQQSDRQNRASNREVRRSNEPWENRSRGELRQARNQRNAERPGLGISFADEDDRPVIRQVHPGSPAEEMGLRGDDRITHVNGVEVATARDVIELIGSSEPGEAVEIEVSRDGDDRSFEGELETRREAPVLRSDRGRRRGFGDPDAGAWNSDRSTRRSYSVRGGDSTRDDFGRPGSVDERVDRQLDSLELQVQQIHREIDRLRRSLTNRGLGQAISEWDADQSDAYESDEAQAGYSEYDGDRSDGIRTSYSYERNQAPIDGFSGRANRDDDRGQEADQDDSPGGVVGGARTRPESDWIDNQ